MAAERSGRLPYRGGLDADLQGVQSGRKVLPGGGPQGTVLGMFLFIILINAVEFHPQERLTGETMTRAANAHTVIRAMHAKYVDDLTVAEALNIKDVLYVKQENELERQLNHHQRNEHGLKDNVSLVKEQLKKIQDYAEKMTCKSIKKGKNYAL